MAHIVITGSTRGIGFGLADAFLQRDCTVTVSGRARASTDSAAGRLADQYGGARVHGCACDVRDPSHVQALWDAAVGRFGRVDLWVNNAGCSPPTAPVADTPPGQAAAAIDTNLLGAIYGSQTATRGMLSQGGGAIYNMEGMGSDGRKHAGLTLYGTTKYGLAYFNDCLFKELQGTPVLAGALRPGMVVTDLIVGQYVDRPEEFSRARRAFNLLAERVEVVAPWLAAQMLANRTHGARLRYLTTGKLLGRMLTAPFVKRELFND